jgi:hypothetical protein
MFDEDNTIAAHHNNNNSPNTTRPNTKKGRALKSPEDPQNVTKLISEMKMEIQHNILPQGRILSSTSSRFDVR